MTRIGLVAFALVGAVLTAACGEKAPLPVGYIGGLSGRVADLGVAGRNGVQLAVEVVNASGGIGGRKLDLLVRDDEQNPELARRRFTELVDAKVAAVLGPMTSGMCAAALPVANQARLLVLSPTCTANELSAQDDHFLRVISPTRVYASRAARHQYENVGVRKVVLVYDLRNKAYTESWSRDFQDTFTSLGGTVLGTRTFESGDDAGLADIVTSILASGPDGVVIVANSVDAALLAQQFRRRAPDLRIAAAEWAATERFIELAGKSAEGVAMSQFFDRKSNAPAYLDFRNRYRERFGEEPGFGGVAAYDAAMVLFEAMRRHPDKSPRDAILAIGRFSGLQGPIVFDAAGDAQRDVFTTRVRDGQFVVVTVDAKQP